MANKKAAPAKAVAQPAPVQISGASLAEQYGVSVLVGNRALNRARDALGLGIEAHTPEEVARLAQWIEDHKDTVFKTNYTAANQKEDSAALAASVAAVERLANELFRRDRAYALKAAEQFMAHMTREEVLAAMEHLGL